MKSACFRALVVTLVLAVASVARGQEPYASADGRWSLTVPPAWRRIDAKVLETLRAELSRRMPNREMDYEGGITKDAAGNLGAPYAIFQTIHADFSTATYEDLEKAFSVKSIKNGADKAAGAVSDLASNLDVGAPTLDRLTNRVFMNITMDVAGVGAMRGASVTFIGRTSAVQVICYAKAAEFDAVRPEFDAVFSSFRYSPGQEYTPAAEHSLDVPQRVRLIIKGAITLGVLLGLLILLGRRWRR